ncbi:hypothetical protein [Pseudomonas veronii]|uniref:hypothetical protein n=1 Tax=Pseudomonas veronii TaxID=76761 RepID=UPI0015A3B9E7|nr:hypothetical protein [Pseudomonas veronii]NWC56408.1 hypothetical protein [Pseudomonas veronii]
MSRPGPACRSELAREKLKDAAFIQDARVIVDVLREQARSYSEKLKDTAFIQDARVIVDVLREQARSYSVVYTLNWSINVIC